MNSTTPALRTWMIPILIAAFMTAVDCLKPIHIDDPTYVEYAKYILEQPLDPYRFSILSYDRPVAANHVLAPPVLLYWFAGISKLVGDDVVLWKASLFPFLLAFVFAVRSLFQRFVGRWSDLWTLSLALSPTFLPSVNMMLDVPALGLAVLGLSWYFAACDRGSSASAIGAGFVLALAIQTKYTALVAPLVVLIYSWMFGRVGLGIATTVVAGLFAAAWEVFLIVRQGESHFLYHAWMNPADRTVLAESAKALCSILGQTTWPFIILGMIGLRPPRWWMSISTIAVVIGLASVLIGDPRTAEVASLGLGALVLLTLAIATVIHLRRSSGDGRFLAAWLVIEFVGYFVLSPFPAVRRTMGIVVVGALCVGRLIATSELSSTKRRWTIATMAAGIVCGLGFAVTDHLDARATKEAADRAMATVKSRNPTGTIWYAGLAGFKYHAAQAGMKILIPADRRKSDPPEVRRTWEDDLGIAMLPPSSLVKGDWLAMAVGVPSQGFTAPSGALEESFSIEVTDSIPWTVGGMYAGDMPMAKRTGPRLRVVLFEVSTPFVPVVGDPSKR
jgi:hypothetical protein